MANVAVFHSVLGVRDGVNDAARRLTEAGHQVLVVDQYAGRSFDDYEEADAFAKGIGYPELMSRAVDAVKELDDGLCASDFQMAAACPSTLLRIGPSAERFWLRGYFP